MAVEVTGRLDSLVREIRNFQEDTILNTVEPGKGHERELLSQYVRSFREIYGASNVWLYTRDGDETLRAVSSWGNESAGSISIDERSIQCSEVVFQNGQPYTLLGGAGGGEVATSAPVFSREGEGVEVVASATFPLAQWNVLFAEGRSHLFWMGAGSVALILGMGVLFGIRSKRETRRNGLLWNSLEPLALGVAGLVLTGFFSWNYQHRLRVEAQEVFLEKAFREGYFLFQTLHTLEEHEIPLLATLFANAEKGEDREVLQAACEEVFEHSGVVAIRVFSEEKTEEHEAFSLTRDSWPKGDPWKSLGNRAGPERKKAILAAKNSDEAVVWWLASDGAEESEDSGFVIFVSLPNDPGESPTSQRLMALRLDLGVLVEEVSSFSLTLNRWFFEGEEADSGDVPVGQLASYSASIEDLVIPGFFFGSPLYLQLRAVGSEWTLWKTEVAKSAAVGGGVSLLVASFLVSLVRRKHLRITHSDFEALGGKKGFDLDELTRKVTRTGGWGIDPDTRNLVWTPEVREIFGVPADFESSVWRMPLFFPSRESRRALFDSLQKAVLSGENFTEDLEIRTLSGDRHRVVISGYAEPREDRGFWVFGSVQLADREHQLQLELQQKTRSLEAALFAQNRVLANMGTQLRIPMNVLIGMTEVLSRKSLSEEETGWVRSVSEIGEMFLSASDDLVEISEMRSGNLIRKPVDFRLSKLVRELSESFLPRMEEKGLVFRVHTAPNVPDLLMGEQTHLRKILANLIENALRYTEKGAVDLRFSVDRRDGKNLTLLCEVEDTGMGISPENVKEIFDPFVRLSSDESAGESGLGLGLTVCRAMVDWLGGDIGVESVSGEGSHFWISAPLITCGEEVKVDGKGWADVKMKGQKVLVAEDNPINQEVIEMILRRANLSYQTVRNGQFVLELLAQEPYDLILMDVRMPVMDGIETTLRIRSGEAGEAFRDIPIIGVTANAMKNQIRECVEAGMNEVLAKPFSVEVLVDLVRRYLDRRCVEESF